MPIYKYKTHSRNKSKDSNRQCYSSPKPILIEGGGVTNKQRRIRVGCNEKINLSTNIASISNVDHLWGHFEIDVNLLTGNYCAYFEEGGT